MKRLVTSSLITLFFLKSAISQDLPGPTANLQSLPVGSYVIPMDNALQPNAAGFFNLKAYGLVCHLLNNDVKVKWVIAAGKLKDVADFSVLAERVQPSLIAGPLSRSFKAGPFVIFAEDLTGVDALITGFYTANALAVNDRPKVYRTAAPCIVDVRYDLSGFRPRAGILNDGGNSNIHTAYMVAAAVPATNYTVTSAALLSSSCFTFSSEPHYSGTGVAADSIMHQVRRFVNSGGNFLAQCEAVITYENNVNGRFQSTTGITTANVGISTTLTYANPDLSFSQIEGAYSASIGGSLTNWRIAAAAANQEHNHAAGTGANANVIGASVSKISSTSTGGLVFYIGNHSFNTGTLAGINGVRMFLNAFMTPNLMCRASVLPVKILSFSGSLNPKTNLQWSVGENETGNHFEIEKSVDGRSFTRIGTITNTENYGDYHYSFEDPTPVNGYAYYRLKVVEKDGSFHYSSIILLKASKLGSVQSLAILENPVTDHITLSFDYDRIGKADMVLYQVSGKKVFSKSIHVVKGFNSHSLPIENNLAAGVYLVELVLHQERRTAKIVKQ